MPSMKGKIGSRNAPMPKNCRVRSEIRAPTTPIQLRAARAPVRTEALLRDGSRGEYDAKARKRRSAEMHSRKPISSFSRRLPVGTKMPVRKRMWAVYHTGLKLSCGANRPEPYHYAKKRCRAQRHSSLGIDLNTDAVPVAPLGLGISWFRPSSCRVPLRLDLRRVQQSL